MFFFAANLSFIFSCGIRIYAAAQKVHISTSKLWVQCRLTCSPFVSMPEWLRGQTRNLMGFARVGSNPAANGTWLDGRAVQGASFRHWSLRRRGFESHSNHFLFFLAQIAQNSANIKYKQNRSAAVSGLDGRAVQGASLRHWSLRRRGFESHSNHTSPLV